MEAHTFVSENMHVMRYKVTILDLIAAVFIFGWALMRYADLYYVKGLDQVGSVLCFGFHILAMTLIYVVLHMLWDMLLKPEVQFILDNILQDESTVNYNPILAIECKIEEAENANRDTETITESVITQPTIIQDIEPYKPYERRNLHVEQVDTLYDFMYQFVGQYLDEDGKTVMRENLLLFSTEKKPDLKPVPLTAELTYHKYDILHLCHGIGNHTRKSRTVIEIAKFAIICFPKLFAGDTPGQMSKKLTCIDYSPVRIPVFDKKEPLPRFDRS